MNAKWFALGIVKLMTTHTMDNALAEVQPLLGIQLFGGSGATV